jgi:hypothetical protein
MKLRRVAIGPISDPDLMPGEWRELTEKEVKMLASMKEKPAKRRTPVRSKGKKSAAARPASKKRSAARRG